MKAIKRIVVTSLFCVGITPLLAASYVVESPLKDITYTGSITISILHDGDHPLACRYQIQKKIKK
jgi:hypothetical protein